MKFDIIAIATELTQINDYYCNNKVSLRLLLDKYHIIIHLLVSLINSNVSTASYDFIKITSQKSSAVIHKRYNHSLSSFNSHRNRYTLHYWIWNKLETLLCIFMLNIIQNVKLIKYILLSILYYVVLRKLEYENRKGIQNIWIMILYKIKKKIIPVKWKTIFHMCWQCTTYTLSDIGIYIHNILYIYVFQQFQLPKWFKIDERISLNNKT